MKFFLGWKEKMSAAAARLWTHQLLDTAEIIGRPTPFIYVIREGVDHAYISDEAMSVHREYSRKFFDPEYQKALLAVSRKRREDFEAFFKEYSGKRIKETTGAELAENLRRFGACYRPLTACFQFSQTEFTEGPFHFLKEKMAASKIPEVDRKVSVLLQPNVLDVLKREELRVLEAARQGYDASQIRAHAREFGLLFYNSYDEEENIRFLENRVSDLEKLGNEALGERIGELRAGVEKTAKEQQEIEGELGDPELAALAFFLRDMGVDRFELKNSWAGAEFRFVELFQETAKRVGLSLEELMRHYTLEEMAAALEGGELAPLEEMKRRRAFYAYHNLGGRLERLEAEEAVGFVRKWIPDFFEEETARELSGMTASHGFWKGRARVIINAGIKELLEEAAAFAEGEILVTGMTQPNMVVLARKAGAIVTDEGGITSHAAVISREFGIPCVVGTRKATKAIKTGDLLEVDASNSKGIVKIEKAGG